MADDPPYLRIVADIRGRIDSGELAPGDRVPSTRQLMRDWGVAMATATKALNTLQHEGLVESRAGIGTVVTAREAAPRATPRRSLSRERVLTVAIEIADREGLEAVSMRRVASEFGVGAMALYRYVGSKDELVTQMYDQVFGDARLSRPQPDDWRAALEAIARLQWDLCCRHSWVPRLFHVVRPLLVPNAMAQSEWALAALDGLGLSPRTMVTESMSLATLVMSASMIRSAELDAVRQSGITAAQWWEGQTGSIVEILENRGFTRLAALPDDVGEVEAEALFEYSLARHLDGLALLIAEQGSRPQRT